MPTLTIVILLCGGILALAGVRHWLNARNEEFPHEP